MFRRYALILLLLSGLGALGALTAHAAYFHGDAVFSPYLSEYNAVGVSGTHNCAVGPYNAATWGGALNCYTPSGGSNVNGGDALNGGGSAGATGSNIAEISASPTTNYQLIYGQQWVSTAIDSWAIPYSQDNPFVTSPPNPITITAGQSINITWAFQDYMNVEGVSCTNQVLFIGCSNTINSSRVPMYGTPTANFNLGGQTLTGTAAVTPTQSTTYTITAPILTNNGTIYTTLSLPVIVAVVPTCSITSVTAPSTSGGTATINYTDTGGPFAAQSGTLDNSIGTFTPVNNTSGSLASGPITFTSSPQTITYNMTVTNAAGSGTCGGSPSGSVAIPAACPANSTGNSAPNCVANSGYTYNSSTNTCSAAAPACPANCPGSGAPSCVANSGYTYDSSNNTCTAASQASYTLTGPASVTSGTAPTLTYSYSGLASTMMDIYVYSQTTGTLFLAAYGPYYGYPVSGVGSLAGDSQTAAETYQFETYDNSAGWVYVPSPTVTVGVTAASSCTFNGNTVADGNSVTAYQTSTVTSPATCASQTRTCSSGTLSGSYTYSSCSVVGASCTFNGNTIPSGNSVTAYQTSTVTSPTTCGSISQTRTCTNGTLSGSYTYPSCSVAAVATLSTFSASPSRVRAGGISYLSWSTSNMASCSLLQASNHSSVSVPLSSSGTQTPVHVSRAEIYTLSCVGNDSNTYTATVTITLVPTFIEI